MTNILEFLKIKWKKSDMLDKFKKKRQVSHGTCSYVHMYINAVTNSVVLQLYGPHFCNIIYKFHDFSTMHLSIELFHQPTLTF